MLVSVVSLTILFICHLLSNGAVLVIGIIARRIWIWVGVIGGDTKCIWPYLLLRLIENKSARQGTRLLPPLSTTLTWNYSCVRKVGDFFISSTPD